MGAAEHHRSWGPALWCVIAAILFGASTPACKPLVSQLGPLLLSGLLYLGAALAVAPWALRGIGQLRRNVDGRTLARLVGAVVFGGIVGPVLLLMGLSLAPAGSVALWLNLETVATAVLAWLFFAEHLGRSTWLAVALIVAASMLLWPGLPSGGWAAALVGLACVAWGLDNNLTAVIDRVTPAQITFVKGLIAGVTNVGLGLSLGTGTPTSATVGVGLLIGALSYGASLLLYIAGSHQLGATRSQLVFSTAPIWGLTLAWIVLREPVRPMQLAAAGLMGVAIYLWHREHHSHAHSHVVMTHGHWHRHDDGHHEHEHPDEPAGVAGWHAHEHSHDAVEHEHPHRPDLHHRHPH
jgi:drug/metabolite transporter (DMT)-like permease